MNFNLTALARAIFFPPRCLGCGKRIAAGVLCSTCHATVLVARTLTCGECGDRLFGDKVNCHPDFPYLLGAAGSYENEALRSLVHALKFGRVRGAAEPLAGFLLEHARSLGTILDGGIVIPIPLSRPRERRRGFNQSELIARPLAAGLGLPLSTEALLRVKHTKPQSETANVRERKENIRGCFAVPDAALVRGQKIILVDDVTTSGATFLEAATTLKRAGAGSIFALAAARA